MAHTIAQQFPFGGKRGCDLLPQTFWTTIDIDYEAKFSPPVLKSLADISAEKLVSDVYLLYHAAHDIPVLLHHLLLQKALTFNRVLSIIHLLKCYPKENFYFPIPSNLKKWYVFYKQLNELKSIFSSFKMTAEIVTHTFFCIVNNNINSQLQILDMNEVSIDTTLLVKCLKTITSLKNPPQQSYLLKTGLIVIEEEDLKIISSAIKSPSLSTFFKLKVTGLHIYNSISFKKNLLKLLKLLQDDELQHFSIELCLSRYNSIFPNLARFHNLHSLSLTYVDGFASDENFTTLFSKTLNNFPNLKRLSFRGSCLSNHLRTLMKQDCRTHYLEVGEIPQNCCLLHRGTLEYLDLSSCRLRNDDLLCLTEFSSTKKLKYLNLCSNTLNASRLSETIKMLGSSLVILDIDGCFTCDEGSQEIFSVLEFMPKLKSLNMKYVPITIEDLQFLSNVVKKMPEFRQVFISSPSDELTSYSWHYYKSLISESNVKVFSYPLETVY